VQGLDASVVFPNEALELGRAVSELRAGLGQDLISVGLAHVIGQSLAALGGLVSLDKGLRVGIVLPELEVTCLVIIAEGARHCQILGASIEHYVGRLTLRRAQVDSAHIDSIVLAQERDLQLELILVVFSGVGYLRDKLGDLSLLLDDEVVASLDVRFLSGGLLDNYFVVEGGRLLGQVGRRELLA